MKLGHPQKFTFLTFFNYGSHFFSLNFLLKLHKMPLYYRFKSSSPVAVLSFTRLLSILLQVFILSILLQVLIAAAPAASGGRAPTLADDRLQRSFS